MLQISQALGQTVTGSGVMKYSFGMVLAGGFVLLSTLAAATGNFAQRLELAQQAERQIQAEQPQSVLASAAEQPAAAIGIQRIALAEGAAGGFGQFRERTNVIAPGTPFHIYFEPTSLATRFENGNVSASMTVDILLRDSEGRTVAVRDNAWHLPLVRPAPGPAALTEVYGDLMLSHLTFAEGSYQIVLRIHDDFGGTFIDQVLDIELRQETPTPAPRLSQTTASIRTP